MNGLTARELTLLRAVHADPGLTRADAARLLEIGSGAMSELVARLGEARLLGEQAAEHHGGRGRPTRSLVAHPRGPLVAAAAITQESWQVDIVSLGGAVLATSGEHHRGFDGPAVLGAVSHALRRHRARLLGRLRGIGISVPGTVLDGRLLDAVNLGWRSLDIRAVWPRAPIFQAGNDATLAALAESRRGAARAAGLALHVRIEGGLGGAVIDRGTVLDGALGVAGEFGHMPFGDPAIPCPCGARGCWGTAVDGTALARLLGARKPRDPVSYARTVLRRAAAGQDPERLAVAAIATALGRGVAGLVNGLDPELVTLGGLAADLAAIAAEPLERAYRAGLMEFRRAQSPPMLAASLGDAGPRIGAAEQVWDQLWRQLSA